MHSFFPRYLGVLIGIMGVLTLVVALGGDARGAVVDEDWVVSTDEGAVSDQVFEMRANLTITSTGQVSLRRVTFTFMSETPGQYGIVVQPGGYLLADNSTFKAGDLSPGLMAEPWTFYALDASRLALTRCTIKHIGMPGGNNNQKGLALTTDNAWIYKCTFDDNFIGITVNGGAHPGIDDNLFEENLYAGIEVLGPSFRLVTPNRFISNTIGIFLVDCADAYIYGNTFSTNNDAIRAVRSIVVAENCTIDGIGKAVKSEVSSRVEVVNSTVWVIGDMATASYSSTVLFLDCESPLIIGSTVVDSTSTIKVKYTLGFKVVYKGADSPVDGAQVELHDSAGGTKVYQQVTVNGGFTPPEPVIIFTHQQSHRAIKHIPFKIVASEGYNYKEIEGFEPGPHEMTIIYFEDELLPELTITSPPNGGTYNTRDVSMNGRSTDKHSGLKAVYFTVDGGDPHNLPLDPMWQVTVTLPEGRLILVFTAEDLVGNKAILERNIIVDVTAPTVWDVDPPNANVTRSYQLLVTGRTEPGTTVTVGSETLELDEGGNFSDYVTLGDEEGEQTITFDLEDAVGNVGQYDYVVVVDRSPPDLTVETKPDYRDFPILNVDHIQFFGTSEPGARVIIDLSTGYSNETLVDGDGNWQMDVELALGENIVTVDAYDGAGNRRTNEIIDFLLDQTMPEITILRPANGTVTKGDMIIVEMRTDPDSTVWVNDGPERIMPLHGELEFEVAIAFKGENNITVYSRDPAGNLATKVVTVVREEKANGDNNGSPGPGPWFVVAALVIAAALAAVARTALVRRG